MKTQVIEITAVKHLNKYKLEIHFSDNSKRVIDFDSFFRYARNPMTKKYSNLKEFLNFRIEYGDLVWGDYEMCFPIWDLHEGRI